MDSTWGSVFTFGYWIEGWGARRDLLCYVANRIGAAAHLALAGGWLYTKVFK